METPFDGVHQTQEIMHDSTVGTALPDTRSTPCNNTPTSRLRAHDTISMHFRMQEKYLNLHTKHLADTSIQNALDEVQHKEKQKLADLN